MDELVFVNEETGKTYRIVNFDEDAKEVTLVGEHGVEFRESFSREKFEKLGYTLRPTPTS